MNPSIGCPQQPAAAAQQPSGHADDATDGAGADAVFDGSREADLPAPAGGLVPPTMANGLPGVGPGWTRRCRLEALGDLMARLRRLNRSQPGRTDAMPELRKTVDEWLARQRRVGPPISDAVTGMEVLDELVTLSSKDQGARRKHDSRSADKPQPAWMNPLAHHHFGPPLQTARFDDQYIGPPEAQNLAGWLAG